MRPVIPIIFGSLAIIIGIGGLVTGLWQAFRSIESAHWPVAPGTILRSQMDYHQGKGSRRDYYLKISYQYEVAGSNYVSQQFAFGPVSGSQGDIQFFLEKYPVGKTVPVHYSPNNPQLAILEPGLHNGLWTNLIVGTLFIFAGSLFLFAVKKGKFRGPSPVPARA